MCPSTDASWDFGDGSPLSDLTAPAHTYTNIGLYEVSLIIRNDVGCLDTMNLRKWEVMMWS